MRQRYAYGSNSAAVRCGWEDRIMSNGAWENRNLQSGAVLWLRHSFARAFSGDFVMLSVSVASLCLESRKILLICHCERAHWASVAINRQGIPIRLIATRLAPLAMTRDNDVSGIQHG